MEPNIIALLIAALLPLLIYHIWYSPFLAGRAVQATAHSAPARGPGRAALRVFLLLLFGLLLTGALMPLVIHQAGVYSMLQGQPQAEVDRWTTELMKAHGRDFRTFRHGALHGAIAGIFFALPVLGIAALSERKRAKTVLMHAGFFIVTLALMGGVICAYA